MFVSSLLRSSGAAIAVSYGAVLVVRVAAWLATSVMSGVLVYALVDPAIFDLSFANPGVGLSTLSWLAPSVVSLLLIVIEVFAALLLIWGAIWQIQRE
jgi:hypothetical protein